LPQEDFCQATGTPPIRKYEAEGGPGIEGGMRLLDGSDIAQQDKRTFLLAQFAFWLMGATDGHAKNFSIRIDAGGRYVLTPLYDVISVWPVVGKGASQLSPRELKLAMAIRGKSAHYRFEEIQPHHWLQLGRRYGITDVGELLDGLAADLPAQLDRTVSGVLAAFPAFPAQVAEAIVAGMKQQAARYLRLRAASEADGR
jgi:serine/threonine-protein kinase HipA